MPGLAADRLRARLGVADAREDRGGRFEQALLLDLEPDLERRGVAAARDRRLGWGELGHRISLDRLPAVRKTALLSVLALAVTGCGGAASDSAKEFKGEEGKVAAVVEQIEKAAREDKPDAVCETPAHRRRASRSSRSSARTARPA